MIFSIPVRLVKLAYIGFVLVREGALRMIHPSLVPLSLRFLLRCLRLIEHPSSKEGHLVTALYRLGPSYVKFGQFLATRPDLVGVDIAQELRSLQDQMPAFPKEVALQQISNSLQRPWQEVFTSIKDVAAAASIAQVHQAYPIHSSGTEEQAVAIKLLRPLIRSNFQSDLKDMEFAARLLEYCFPSLRRLRPLDVVATLARSVTLEMDLRLEAAALSELAENTRGDHNFYVPKVYWDYTTKDMLVSEWIDGISLKEIDFLQEKGYDLPTLADRLVQSFLQHALQDGFFHADMHQGNLLIDQEGRLVAIDCGIMGRLSEKERYFLAQILYGFIIRDYPRVAKAHFEAGYVPSYHSIADFAQAIRAIGEPIHNKSADQISMAGLLGLLFEITALFDMETRTELVMLQKTMVVVEGVGRSLNPHLNIWKAAEPVVRIWIENHLGPRQQIEHHLQDLCNVADSFRSIPLLIERAEKITSHMLANVEKPIFTDQEYRKASRRGYLWMASAQWLIAALLALLLARSIF